MRGGIELDPFVAARFIFNFVSVGVLVQGEAGNGIFPASIDPRKNISAFVASMEKSRLSEIKFIAGAR